MKDSYYFPHDNNSYFDEKIIKLRMKLGLEGYGVYWAVIEQLHQNNGYMDFDADAIAYALQMPSKCVASVIKDFGLFSFQKNSKKFFSKRLLLHFKKRKSISKKRSEAGKLGAKQRNKSLANAKQMPSKCSAKLSKGKERKGKENNISTKVDIGKAKKPPNKFVDYSFKRFKEIYGFNHNDKNGRRSAWAFVQRLKGKIPKEKQVDENLFKAIDLFFDWVPQQNSLEKVKNIDTLRRNIDIFYSQINYGNKKSEKATGHKTEFGKISFSQRMDGLAKIAS